MNTFLVSNIDKVTMFDCETFAPLDLLPITLMKADSREPN